MLSRHIAGIMTKLNDLSSPLAFLKTRKSGSVKALGLPGPNPGEISEILDIAVRVPDHGKLTPWRFVLFEGAARADIGQVFAERWKALHPEHCEDSLAFQRGLAGRGLSEPGRQHAAHVDPLDILALHSGAFDRGLDRRGAEIGRRDIGKNAR